MTSGDMRAGARERIPVSVVTRMRVAAPVERVWDGLMLFEQIPERPPLLLRLLLPAPTRAEGPRSAVGDEIRCVYERGYLLKRATQIDRWRRYTFEVAEQQLTVGNGIQLLSGGYALRQLPDRTTRIELATRYVSRRRPAWLWRAIEAAVCHAFHRHILAAMRREVERRQRKAEAMGRPDEAGDARDEGGRGEPVLRDEARRAKVEGDGASEHEAVEARHAGRAARPAR